MTECTKESKSGKSPDADNLNNAANDFDSISIGFALDHLKNLRQTDGSDAAGSESIEIASAEGKPTIPSIPRLQCSEDEYDYSSKPSQPDAPPASAHSSDRRKPVLDALFKESDEDALTGEFKPISDARPAHDARRSGDSNDVQNSPDTPAHTHASDHQLRPINPKVFENPSDNIRKSAAFNVSDDDETGEKCIYKTDEFDVESLSSALRDKSRKSAQKSNADSDSAHADNASDSVSQPHPSPSAPDSKNDENPINHEDDEENVTSVSAIISRNEIEEQIEKSEASFKVPKVPKAPKTSNISNAPKTSKAPKTSDDSNDLDDSDAPGDSDNSDASMDSGLIDNGNEATRIVIEAMPDDDDISNDPVGALPAKPSSLAAKPPDLAELRNLPAMAAVEFERTLIFERNENRWDSAIFKNYKLPNPGDTVDNYKIESLLGKGGFGAVYCAKNLTLGREEALKLILPSAAAECSDIEKRFKREIDVVSRLEHPNVVRLYSSGALEHNIMWMTMELVHGDRLDTRLAERGAMPFLKARSIMLQLLAGLMDAHKRHIVHRDLKPANIMLAQKEGYDDQVTILDFGLSKAIGSNEDTDVQELTKADSRRVYGTPQYMAPEQLNYGILGPWTDVYASGLIFLEMLTGKEAVSGDSLFDVAYKQTYELLEFPPQFKGTAVEALIQHACAKKPEHRFQSANEFYDALRHIASITDPASVIDGGCIKVSSSLAEISMMCNDARALDKKHRNDNENSRKSHGSKAIYAVCCILAILLACIAVGYFMGLIQIVPSFQKL